jgi:glycosyltransferase involved in cell wall biosynthesis
VAGACPPPDITSNAADGLDVTGFLDDPAPCFCRAHLAILPLSSGAGVKVKVLECLASGLPVLTTAIGAEGIEATEKDGLLVLPFDEEVFARTTVDLARNPDRLASLSTAALCWTRQQSTEEQHVLLDI